MILKRISSLVSHHNNLFPKHFPSLQTLKPNQLKPILIKSPAQMSSSPLNSNTNSPSFSRKITPLPQITSSTSKQELYHALETSLGSPFSTNPPVPSPKPIIIVISGPSGVGKDSIIARLRKVKPGLHFVVTATTRARRVNEVDSVDYYFVSKEAFVGMVKNDELLEYAMVYGDYKGIPKKQIREHMEKGDDIVLRVDIQGAKTLRKILGDEVVFVFLVAESESALVKRLVERESETVESLLVRISTAREEVLHIRDFDYVVVNKEGRMEEAVGLLGSIIDAEKARVRQRNPMV